MTPPRDIAVQAYGPNSPYAWWRLLASLAVSTIGCIGLWSVVVSLPTIEAEFGVDRGDASLPYTATMAGFAIGGVLMGRLSDRFGIKVPIAIGGTMLGVGYIAAAQAAALWQFILAQALLIGMLGTAVCFGPLVADVSLWFLRRRGLAVAVVASGNYLAGTIWPPLLQYGIETVGWRQAHEIIGVICFVTLLPLAYILRRRPHLEDVRAAPAGHRGSGHRGAGKTGSSGAAAGHLSPALVQTLLVIAGLACCVAMAMPQVHIVAYCVDLDYGAARGAEMLSMMLGFGVISRIASGAIADRIGGIGTLMLGSTLQCLALLFYLPFDGLTPLYIVSAIFGLSQGGIVPSYALIVRDYFPARQAGTRISLVLMATVFGMALGGWMSGAIYDLTHSYQAAFLNGIAFNLLNMTIVFWLLMGRRRAQARVAV